MPKKSMLGMGKRKTKTSKSFELMIKQAQSQPGVKELFDLYGQYNELLIQSQEYLGLINQTESFSANNTTQ